MTLLLILALLLTTVVADVAIETGEADGTRIVAAGTDLLTGLTLTQTIAIVAAGAAVAAALLVAVLGTMSRRRKARRVAEAAERVSQREAGLESRRQLIESRLEELQRNHDELLVRRDALLAEVERLRERDAELQETILERHREIADARHRIEALRGDGEVVVLQADDDAVELPDADRARRA